jgi:hypothetical protein
MYASLRPPAHSLGNADAMNTGYMGKTLPGNRVTNPLNAQPLGASWTYGGASRQEMIWSKHGGSSMSLGSTATGGRGPRAMSQSSEAHRIKQSRSQPHFVSSKARSKKHSAGLGSGNFYATQQTHGHSKGEIGYDRSGGNQNSMVAANSKPSNPDARLQNFLQNRFSGPNIAINPKFQMNTDIHFNQRSVTRKHQLKATVDNSPSWSFKQPQPIDYRNVNRPPAGMRSTGSSAYQYTTSIQNNQMATTRHDRHAW